MQHTNYLGHQIVCLWQQTNSLEHYVWHANIKEVPYKNVFKVTGKMEGGLPPVC